MSEDEYWDDSIDWHTVSETPALNSTHASTSTGANVTTTNPQEHSRATADMANPFYTERDTVGGRFTSSSRANVPLQASSSTSTQPSSSTMKRPVAESESVRKRRRQAILDGLKDNVEEKENKLASAEDWKARIMQIWNEEMGASYEPRPLKGGESPGKKVRGALSQYDEELSCPICFDLFIAPQLLNPCGHSVCGDCIDRWLRKKPRAPDCPTCRTRLSRSTPHIPNFAIDNTIQKHIDMLRSHKSEDWLDEGSKWKERIERKRQYEEASSRTRDVPPPPPPNAEANRHGGQALPINLGTFLRTADIHYNEHGYFQMEALPLRAIEILSSDDEEYSPTEDEDE